MTMLQPVRPIAASFKITLGIALFFSALFAPVSDKALAAPQYIKAYKVDVHHWTWGEPHYGAFWYQAYPYSGSQRYVGPGGSSATCSSSAGCIGSWGWVGTWYHILLVPKGGWLWTEPPWGAKWQGGNYEALFD
jgi:hypothetical protein